jgi:DNA mismatch repair protein MutL
MRIKQLPLAVANQIAAGEVIERPASVVKELLENSLDAKATAIQIEITSGGFNQIKISDNGLGIVAEDLPLAIAPHATSKINRLQDLYSIASMGFRGEALASIASISRLTISSKPAEQRDAMRLISDGEKIHLQPCARTQGTTIDVRDIFFNAPVRKKFLKTERLEFQAIEQVVKRFALGEPSISISLSHNNKKVLQLSAAHCEETRLLRIRKIFGKFFCEQIKYLDAQHLGLRLWGWVTNLNYDRSQNDKQWIYVNKRMVKDKLLNHAMKQAYEGFLHPGRHPACLLYLEIKPEEIDVNVHPTKHEVRFQQPRLVHDFVSLKIQQTLKEEQNTIFYKPIAVSPPTVLSVREALVNPLREKGAVSAVQENKSWISLNPPFALLTLGEEFYLVDAVLLQRQWLVCWLLEQTLPLARRPLLVPVTQVVKDLQAKYFYSLQQQLAQIGIELDLISDKTILVRSLPIAVPHLNLKSFLSAIVKEEPFTNKELMEMLSYYQTFDANQASQEEKNALIAYLYNLKTSGMPKYCRHLSAKFCQDLLHA